MLLHLGSSAQFGVTKYIFCFFCTLYSIGSSAHSINVNKKGAVHTIVLKKKNLTISRDMFYCLFNIIR